MCFCFVFLTVKCIVVVRFFIPENMYKPLYIPVDLMKLFFLGGAPGAPYIYNDACQGSIFDIWISLEAHQQS